MKRALIALVLLNLACLGLVVWQRPARTSVANESAAAIEVPQARAAVSSPVRRTDHEVVMYGTAWCGYCAKTRQYFAANGVRYTEHDIETSDEGRRGYEALNGRGIPLVVIDGTVLQGFNPQNMDALLAR